MMNAMKNTFLILCGMLMIAAASCTKAPQENQGEGSCGPIQISFSASIGDIPQTRLTYTQDGNLLKSSWNKTWDKISLVAVDSDGNMLSNDIFTAQKSGDQVLFSGTYTNDSKTFQVIMYYPAFTVGEGPYYSPINTSYNHYSSHGPFGMDGSELILDDEVSISQPRNGALPLLENFTLMTATVDPSRLVSYYFKNPSIPVKLMHSTYIIKAELKMPESNPEIDTYAVTRVNMRTMNSTGNVLTYSGSGYIGSRNSVGTFFWGGFQDPQQDMSLSLGNITSSGMPAGIYLMAGEVLTVYMVGFRGPHDGYHPHIDINDVRPFRIEVEHIDGESLYAVSTKEIDYIEFIPGKIYRLSATLADPAASDQDTEIYFDNTGIGFHSVFPNKETDITTI